MDLHIAYLVGRLAIRINSTTSTIDTTRSVLFIAFKYARVDHHPPIIFNKESAARACGNFDPSAESDKHKR
jgi:hypothetical protein